MKLRHYFRVFRGFCPACNSAMPEINNCNVCTGYRSSFRHANRTDAEILHDAQRGYSFPPPLLQRLAWLYRMEMLSTMELPWASRTLVKFRKDLVANPLVGFRDIMEAKTLKPVGRKKGKGKRR